MVNINRVFYTIGFFLFLACSTAQAAPSIKDYGTLPAVQMVAISPSGQFIAYRRVNDLQDVVIVASLAEKKTVLALDVSAIQPRFIKFFNDDQILLNVSTFRRVNGFIGKFDLSVAYLLNIKSKAIKQLMTPGETILAGQSGLGRVIGTTSDGKYALMPAFSQINVGFDEPKYALYKVDLSGGRMKVADDGGFNTDDFFVDGAGNPIAKIDFDERKNRHTVFAKSEGRWKPIFKENIDIRSKSFVGVTPDFKSLVMLDTDEESGRYAYYTMSLSDGKITGPLYGREDADVDGVISDTQQVVYGIRYSGLTPSYLFFDSSLDKRIKDIQANFPEHSVWISSWSPDWKHIVVNVEGSAYADDYFLFSEGKAPEFLTTGRPQFSENDISPIGKVTLQARDGLKIPTLITIPRDKITAMKNLPAVIYPHGGPASFDSIGFDYFAQALASQGYLVVQPQFRGSTGYGKAHYAAGHGEWGKKMQDDLTDSVNFFVAKGYIDPKKVCIVGGSYGGYAALAGGAFTPDIYQCVVSINGIGNINNMLSWDKSKSGSESEVAAYMEMQFANGKAEKSQLTAISPENSASNFKAPVLLIHSVNDKRVPVQQSRDMLSALKHNKKEVELIELVGDDHHLTGNQTRQKAVEATVDFVNKHLKTAAESVIK